MDNAFLQERKFGLQVITYWKHY